MNVSVGIGGAEGVGTGVDSGIGLGTGVSIGDSVGVGAEQLTIGIKATDSSTK